MAVDAGEEPSSGGDGLAEQVDPRAEPAADGPVGVAAGQAERALHQVVEDSRLAHQQIEKAYKDACAALRGRGAPPTAASP